MPTGRADPLNNLLTADGGAGFSGGGSANTLPNRFTDDSILTIAIPIADFAEDAAAPGTASTAAQAPAQAENKTKKGSWFSRKMSASGKSGGGTTSKKGEIRMVRMTRREYLAYWAKGEDGRYLPDVVEPDGGRRAWVLGKLGEL